MTFTIDPVCPTLALFACGNQLQFLSEVFANADNHFTLSEHARMGIATTLEAIAQTLHDVQIAANKERHQRPLKAA